MIVVDDYSRYTTVFPLRRKADVPTVLESWLLARGGVQGLCGLCLHSDRGGKFYSTCLETLCQGPEIIQSYTLPDSPQQNGVAERRIGLVMEVARTSMCHAAGDYCVWGCLAHVRAPGANKLSVHIRACVFLGIPLDASGWVFYDPATHQFFASQDVTFDESASYYRSRPHRGSEALVTTVTGFASSHRFDNAAHLVSGPASSLFSGRAPVFPLEVLEDRQFELGFLAATVPHLYAMLLAREGDTDALDIPITCNHAEAVSGPWAPYWIAAEEAEMASYRSTGTYVDAVPPPRANVVSGMWLYKVKRLPGAPPMFKARYVVRGFSQREGLDFFQTFAPTPKMTTLWVLLHIAVQRDYELHSLDFSTAFLHEQIWLRRPHGFTSSFPPGTQWQLRRPV
ncbi:unnamed protein product [Closterium sp. NIES-54]